MTHIHINDELAARVREYAEKYMVKDVSLNDACEQLILRGMAEKREEVQFEAPTEDAVKNRLQALGYLD